jgi:hypothetical protein
MATLKIGTTASTTLGVLGINTAEDKFLTIGNGSLAKAFQIPITSLPLMSNGVLAADDLFVTSAGKCTAASLRTYLSDATDEKIATASGNTGKYLYGNGSNGALKLDTGLTGTLGGTGNNSSLTISINTTNIVLDGGTF